MPLKKWAWPLFLLLGSGLSVYMFSDYLSVNQRAPSRVSPGFLQSKFTSKGVVNRIVQIELNFTEAAMNSEKAEISAEVRMPFDFNEKLYFKWHLGPDVILSAGELTGEIQGLLKGLPQKLHLTVTGFSKENNHHIRLEVRGTRNGKNIYGDALIASDLENTFENTVQNVEKIKSSQ